jgi:hypothetical protein
MPTQQEQANGQAAEASLGVFLADPAQPINADAFGNLANTIYGVANTSYTGMTVAPPRLYAECATIVANRVDFHCNINNTSSTTTLNGSVSRNINGASVAWHVDLSMSVSSSSTNISQSTSIHLTGDVTVTGGAQINGSLSMSANIHIQDQGTKIDGTIDSTVSYNKLVYDTTNQCVTSGNIVITLDGSANGRSISQAVRYTFTGCQTFTIAVAK